jgi:hypothetical protein
VANKGNPAKLARMEDDPRAREISNGLTPEQTLNTLARLYWSARELKGAYLRSVHPEWSEETIQREVRHAFLTTQD